MSRRYNYIIILYYNIYIYYIYILYYIEWLLQFFEGPVMLENVTVVGNHIQGEGKQPIHCGPVGN
eukprot:COSAG06_NODE_1896_length_8121_cov_3.278733_8_plen_65_part_00